METTNAKVPDYPRGLTFEQVWASIQELRESHKETERLLRESARRLDKKLGDLGNRFGEMIESLASPGLKTKFRALGFDFTKSSRDTEFTERKIQAQGMVEGDLQNQR